MTNNVPATMEQLPRTAALYYELSISSEIFQYVEEGRDGAGRRIYQKYLGGEKYGAPRALLSFAEFRRDVLAAAKISSSMGVPRWTDPWPALATNDQVFANIQE